MGDRLPTFKRSEPGRLLRGASLLPCVFLLLLPVLTHCTNDPTAKNRKPILNSNSNGSAFVTDGDFQITLLLKSGQLVNGIDVRGDGTGTLGSLCSRSGACVCVIKYQTPNSPERIEEYPVQDVETDFLRCNLSGLAAGVVSATLQIKTTSNQKISNALPLDFAGLDQAYSSTNAKAYTLVKRFQCRPILWIPYLFDSKVADPIQTEDPRLNFGINFYTTQWRQAWMSFLSTDLVKDWDCPTSLEDPESMRDMGVYFENNGTISKLFPPSSAASGAVNGTEFYVSKLQDSLFSVPINPKLQAPGIGTVNLPPGSRPSAGSIGSIGFGAAPDANSELCPSPTLIPTGFRWVKLWLYRGTAQPRKYLSSSSLAAQIAGSNQGIYCNPGGGFAPGCANEKSLLDITQGLLATRVVRTSSTAQNEYDVCARVSHLTTSATFSTGSDLFTYTGKPSTWTLAQACSAGYNPLNFLCPSGSGIPNASAEVRDLEVVSSENYLYIVTDASIRSSEMDVARPLTYIPACDPTTTNCASLERVVWEKLNGDQAINPVEQPIYPVCVVQPGSNSNGGQP